MGSEQTSAVRGQSARGQSYIPFSGRALDAEGRPIVGEASVVLSVYRDQSGGTPLWQETQKVITDSTGNFETSLGTNSPAGLPAELLARETVWVGVQAHSEGVGEQSRIPFGGMPYVVAGGSGNAVRSATLASSFVPVQSSMQMCHVKAAVSAPPGTSAISVVGATAGYVPIFSDANGDMTSSAISQTSGGLIGIGTQSATHTLSFGGSTPTSLGVEENPIGGAGNDLAISAGAAGTGSTNQAGGNLVLAAGNGTGSGAGGSVHLQTAGDSISGTEADTISDRMVIVGKPKAMTGAVPTANLFSLHIPTGEAAGGRVKFTIVASDGVNYAMETGELAYLASPKQLVCSVVVSELSKTPPTYTNDVLAVPALGQSGSLNAQCNPAMFGSDQGLQIFDTEPTSFTPTTHKVYFTIENQSQAGITLQP